jgi:hypothetical protein
VSDGIGPLREEVWRFFAKEIGAEYTAGDQWQSERIAATIAPWTVTLELLHESSSGTPCTRLVAPYRSTDRFLFTIYRADAFRDTGVLSRTEEIQVGDAVFDAAFRVAASDPDRIRELLANAHLRQYLLSERQIGIEASMLTNHIGSREAQLVCTVLGCVETRDRLLTLFELMGETLQHLHDLGCVG